MQGGHPSGVLQNRTARLPGAIFPILAVLSLILMVPVPIPSCLLTRSHVLLITAIRYLVDSTVDFVVGNIQRVIHFVFMVTEFDAISLDVVLVHCQIFNGIAADVVITFIRRMQIARTWVLVCAWMPEYMW